MANEMLVLEGDRHQRYGVLMLFPIASPAQAGGQNVVPTPTPLADDGVTPAYPFTLLTAPERAALDGGTAAYRIVALRKAPGLTNPQLVSRLQAIYAEQLDDFGDEYAVRYAHIDTRVDAS